MRARTLRAVAASAESMDGSMKRLHASQSISASVPWRPMVAGMTMERTTCAVVMVGEMLCCLMNRRRPSRLMACVLGAVRGHDEEWALVTGGRDDVWMSGEGALG